MKSKFLVVLLLTILIVCSLSQVLKPVAAQTSYLKSFEKEGTTLKIPTINIVDTVVSYQDTRDFYQFNLTLIKPPASNTISILIESTGLEFIYQPPLDEIFKADGKRFDFVNATHGMLKGEIVFYRPENVVGSFAVYTTAQIKNGTGKLYHIYRPLVIDAKGLTIWGKLNVTKTLLSIEIDQRFLSEANYPVVVDPSFGYSSAGASTYTAYASSAYGYYCALSEAGTTTTMSTYAKVSSGTANSMVAIYSSGTLKAYSNVVQITTTAAWRSYTIAVALAAGNYYLTYQSSANSLMYCDNAPSNLMYAFSNTYGSFPSSVTWGEYDWLYSSIYANYTTETLTQKYFYSVITLTMSLNRGSAWTFSKASTMTLTISLNHVLSWAFSRGSTITLTETLNSLKTLTFTQGSTFPLTLSLNGLMNYLHYQSFFGSFTLIMSLNMLKSFAINLPSWFALTLSFLTELPFTNPGNIFIFSIIGLTLGFWTNGVPPTITDLVILASENAELAIGLAITAFVFAIIGIGFAMTRKRKKETV